jgi:subtilisin family serine protease
LRIDTAAPSRDPALRATHSDRIRDLVTPSDAAATNARPRRLRRAALAAATLLALAAAGSAAGAGGPSAIAGSRASGERVPGQFIVRFRPGTTAAARARVLSAEHARVIRGLGLPGVLLVRIGSGTPRDALSGLESHDRVLWAEPNRTGRYASVPTDPLFARQWGLNNTGQGIPDSDGPDQRETAGVADADIDAPEAWDRTTGDAKVIVAIADSGVAYDHPELAPNIWHNPGESGGGKETNGIDDDGNGFVDDVRGWDFVENDNDPRDILGHGTEVAGVVGARGGDGLGVTGVNQTVSLMALRTGGDKPDSAAIAAAFVYAARNGAKVVNASVTVPSSQAIIDAITSAPNVLFVVAAGNDGTDVDAGTPSFPCSLPAANLICVAATDQNDAIAGFSNRGRTSVDLGAPGATVWTTSVSQSSPVYETWVPNSNPLDWRTNGAWARVTLADGSTVVSDSPGNYPDNSDTAYATNVGFSTKGQFGCALLTTLALDVPLPDVLAVEAAAEGTPFARLSVLSGRSQGFEEVRTALKGLDDTAQVFLRYRLVSDGALTGDGTAIKYVIVRCISSTYRGSEFTPVNGTSFASPMTAGVAALAWAAAPKATVAQVRAAILGGVDPIPSLKDLTVTGGRLNAAKAVANVVSAVTSGGATPSVRRLRVLGARLLAGRRAALRVKCPASATGGCAGTLSLRSLAVPRTASHPAARARELARARFSVAGGRTKVVTVTLSSRSLRALRIGSRRAVLVVTTTAAGTASVARIRVRVAEVRSR